MLPAANSPGPSLHFGGGFFPELSPPGGLLRAKDTKAANPGGPPWAPRPPTPA